MITRGIQHQFFKRTLMLVISDTRMIIMTKHCGALGRQRHQERAAHPQDHGKMRDTINLVWGPSHICPLQAPAKSGFRVRVELGPPYGPVALIDSLAGDGGNFRQY